MLGENHPSLADTYNNLGKKRLISLKEYIMHSFLLGDRLIAWFLK